MLGRDLEGRVQLGHGGVAPELVDDGTLRARRRHRGGKAESLAQLADLERAGQRLVRMAEEPQRHGRPGPQVHRHLPGGRRGTDGYGPIAGETVLHLAERPLEPAAMIQ